MTIEFDELQITGDGSRPHGSDHRRRRLVAGVAATMLVAAAAGAGYGIGRSADRDSADLAAGQAVDEEPATTEAAEETESTVSTAPPATDAEDLGDAAGDGIVSSGGVGYPAFGMQPMETLYERVIDGGFVLRAQMGPD